VLRKFEVKNYKNFRDTICIDFTDVHDYKYNEYCVKDGLIDKMIVYGKNASGKSNLGMALLDLAMDIQSSRNSAYFRNNQHLYKNADAADDELVEFVYSFQIDDNTVDYAYKKKDVSEVVFEELSVNGKIIFRYDLISGESDFSNVHKIGAGELNWNEFLEVGAGDEDVESTKPTALRYIIYNTIQSESSVVYKLAQFIKGMIALSSTSVNRIPFDLGRYFEDEKSLEKFERFLNNYGVNCKLVLKEQLDGKKDLYFDYKKPLHFASNLSSGTYALTRFYLQFFAKRKPTFIYMDEYDAYYHFELSEKIVRLLEEEFDCQVVLTSHNTNLLSNSIMRPDCFMILSGGKLTPICKATNRELRQGHNLEKLYINGEFNV